VAINLFRKMSLHVKLRANRGIEKKNLERAEKTLNHMIDPTNHPSPGSETASFITIDDEEILELTQPSVQAALKEDFPVYITRKLAEMAKSGKRRNDEADTASDSTSAAESRLAKRQCMDGDAYTQKVPGRPIEFIFPQIMYDTELRQPLPIEFFTPKNLVYITTKTASLPVRKANPLEGETKGASIIDIDNLSKKLGITPMSLSYGQWGEAMRQMYKFQASRDKVQDGSWTAMWDEHFTFFSSQTDAEEYYDEWKALEARIRADWHTHHKKYSAEYYQARYEELKNFTELKKSLTLGRPAQAAPGERERGKSKQYQPFPRAGAGSTATVSCVLCAEKSHILSNHSSEHNKFPNGKPVWAKYEASKLRSPEGRELCIRWNLFGSNSSRPCAHGDDRLHICSYCGGKHFALSGLCRAILA